MTLYPPTPRTLPARSALVAAFIRWLRAKSAMSHFRGSGGSRTWTL